MIRKSSASQQNSSALFVDLPVVTSAFRKEMVLPKSGAPRRNDGCGRALFIFIIGCGLGAGGMHAWLEQDAKAFEKGLAMCPTPPPTPSPVACPPPDCSVAEKARDVCASDLAASKELDFYSIGKKINTDKVSAVANLDGCLQDPTTCVKPGCTKERCRPFGHFYHTIYQTMLGKYSKPTMEPFQFLEIGFNQGDGRDTFKEFLPKAEIHSLEISCLPEGPRVEGKWPWGNFAEKHQDYATLLKTNRLHCGELGNVTFLDKVWTTHMKREDSPPLKIVVEDGTKLANDMAQSVFYWFPRIEPGGIMVIEDIQPVKETNWFRARFLPKIMSDLHYCGDPKQGNDTLYFPAIQPFLESVSCEMHICMLGRNEKPATNPSLELSTIPKDVWSDEGLITTWGKKS
jgi:hypothetical protein